MKRLLLAVPLAALCACSPALHKAAARGDITDVKELLDAGADPNAFSGWDGATPLGMAANAEVVDILINHGASVERDKFSPLEVALVNKRWPAAKRLIERGAPATEAARKIASSGGAPADVRKLLGIAPEPYVPRPGLTGAIEGAVAYAAAGGSIREAATRGDVAAIQRVVAALPGVIYSSGWAKVVSDSIQAAQRGGHDNVVKYFAEGRYRRQPAGSAAPAAERPAEVASDVDAPGYSSKPRPVDFAVVVGIEDYPHLPKASHAAHDAAAVKAHMKALGVPERNIISLTGADATRGKLAAYLDEWLPKNVKPESRVYFYYSGHGAPDPKTGSAYLVPADGDPMFLQSTAYPVKDLYAKLAKLPAKQVVVALDACFSGAGGRSVLAEGARPLVTKSEDLRPAGALTVLAAASGEEITGALDEQGHGMFTYYLLKGLSSGKRSTKDLIDFIKPNVQDEARRQNREQTPALLGMNLVLD